MFWEGVAEGPAKLTNLEDGNRWQKHLLNHIMHRFKITLTFNLHV